MHYYYSERYTTKEEITEAFTYKGKKPTDLSEVSFVSKSIKFSDEFLKDREDFVSNFAGDNSVKRKTLSFDVKKIAYVRNTSIHRQTPYIKDHEDQLHNEYTKNFEDWKKRSDQKDPKYKHCWDILFKRQQNFLTVKNRTEQFVRVIESEIQAAQKDTG